MKIYLYDEETKELDSILNPNDYESVKAILYNLSDKNNGYLIYLKPLNINDIDAKKKSDDFKFHCRHIYENNDNFLSRY